MAGNGFKDGLAEGQESETFFSAIVVTLSLATVIGLLMLVCGFGTSGSRGNVESDDSSLSNEKTNKSKKAKSNQQGKRQQKEQTKRGGQSTFSHPLLASTLKEHSSNVLDMDFSINGKYLASCAEDRTVRVWSVKEFKEREHKEGKYASCQQTHRLQEAQDAGRQEQLAVLDTSPHHPAPETIHEASLPLTCTYVGQEIANLKYSIQKTSGTAVRQQETCKRKKTHQMYKTGPQKTHSNEIPKPPETRLQEAHSPQEKYPETTPMVHLEKCPVQETSLTMHLEQEKSQAEEIVRLLFKGAFNITMQDQT